MVTIEQHILQTISKAATTNFDNVAMVGFKEVDRHKGYVVALWHVFNNRYSTHSVLYIDDLVSFSSGDYDLTITQLSEAFDKRNN